MQRFEEKKTRERIEGTLKEYDWDITTKMTIGKKWRRPARDRE